VAKSRQQPPEPGPPQVDPACGIVFLLGQIDKGKKLLVARPINSDDYGSWELVTKNFLEKAFGTNSPNIRSVTDVGKYGSFPMGASEEYWENRRAESLQTQLKKLEGLVELLETEQQLSGEHTPAVIPTIAGHRVFLVHGHEETILHEVARFLEKLEQEIIILREQPNSGRTIIEKFEDYSNVGYAIVLLTPDDRGGTFESEWATQKPRARQNVIFEIGYFIGRLGRNRVCALYRDGVEIPSDYSGVLYVKLDEAGAWRLSLAKEMRASGLPIDMNKAL
jgi:predicted nucleotide-binding protein